MAILKNGINGPVNNKVGSVIGRNFRGQNVITGLYKVKKRKPTEEKEKVRAKLSMLSSFLNSMRGIVEAGFAKTIKGAQSAVNAAFAFNYKHAFVEEDGNLTLNFPKLILSRGPIEQPNCATVVREGTKLIFSWLPKIENAYCRNNDKATFILYHIDKNKMVVLEYYALRSELSLAYEMREKFAESPIQCYMVFSSNDEKLVGNSEYIGIA